MNGPVEERRQHYLNVNYGLKSWLLTIDHKRIAWLYLVGVTFFFFVGGLFATLIRMRARDTAKLFSKRSKISPA